MCSFDIKNLFTSVPLMKQFNFVCSTCITLTTSLHQRFLKRISPSLLRRWQSVLSSALIESCTNRLTESPWDRYLVPCLPTFSLDIKNKRFRDYQTSCCTRDMSMTACQSVPRRRKTRARFLKVLKCLHPALLYTCENKNDGKLPFLDILVKKAEPQKGTVELILYDHHLPQTNLHRPVHSLGLV